MLFHPLVVLKASNLREFMVVQAHTHDGENGRFFLIFQKKAVIYTKLLLFWKKYENIFHFLHHRRVCLNNHNSLKFEAFSYNPADEKASKTFKLFILKQFFVVCLFPTNITQFLAKMT